MKPSINLEKWPNFHKTWSSWETSTTLISVEGIRQPSISNSGGSWNVFIIIFLQKDRGDKKERFYAGPFSHQEEGLVGM